MEEIRTPRCSVPAGLVAPVRVDPTGRAGPRRGSTRDPLWRRCAPGLYVPRYVEVTPHQRVLEQAARLTPVGAVTGWASLLWQGAAYVDGGHGDAEQPVELALGHLGRLRPHPGSIVNRERLGPQEIVEVEGVRCTTVLRAVFDEVRRRSGWRAAVEAAAMTVAAGLTTPEELRADLPNRTGWTAVDRARGVYALVREGHRSGPEVRLGLLWEVDLGFPAPLYNAPVFGPDGQCLGIPDLLDEEAGLAVEYDGAHHLSATQRRADVVRESLLRGAGLECAVVVPGDLGDPAATMARLRAARERAPFTPPERRRWTLDKPAWWGGFAARYGIAG